MSRPTRIPRLLVAARAAVKEQGTNPYRLAQATGLSTASIRNLLSDKVSPSLRNIELVLHVLGLEVEIVTKGPPTAKPGRSAVTKPRKNVRSGT